MVALLGVIVDGGQIYRMGALRARGALLGPLAGAEAGVTDGTSRHTLTRVVTVVGVFTKKHNALAYVIAGNGTVHEVKLANAGQIRRAQAEAVRFNALVRAFDREAESSAIQSATFTAEDRAREAARRAGKLAPGPLEWTGDYPPGDRNASGYKPEQRYPRP